MIDLTKNGYGFYSVKNPPSPKELKEYYEGKYYQEAKGSYEINYDDEEINYFKNKIEEKAFVVEMHLNKYAERSLLVIGCDEGWALNSFKEKSWNILGLDYSS